MPAPDAPTLADEHLPEARPLILTGLLDRPELHRLADRDRARAELGPSPFEVERGATPVPFRDVLDVLTEAEDERALGLELPLPAALARRFGRRPYPEVGDADDPYDQDVFMGNRGTATHLHFDVDLRDVVVYQVFGRKRYVIIDPAQTRKLGESPTGEVTNFSPTFLQNFEPDDLRAFLEYTRAWDCVVRPGEALLIPAMAWHYVEYLDTALSVHFRLRRNRHRAWLAEAGIPTGVEYQALAVAFRTETAIDRTLQAAFDELMEAANRRYRAPSARAGALHTLAVELCARLGLDPSRAPYFAGAVEQRDPKLAGTAAFTV